MATSPHQIDPSTYLDELLTQASPDLMRQMLQSFINQILPTQADQICGADYAITSESRTNTRNGYRHRDLDTRVGTVDVAVPKLRAGSFFPDWLLERRSRAERAVSTVIATCYLKGVSTRRMNDLVASLGITSLSKSQVSTMAKDLDSMVEDFRHRPLDGGPYLYVSCDASTMKVREGGRVVKTSVLLACGVNAEGYRELLGMQVATAESVASWTRYSWSPATPTWGSSMQSVRYCRMRPWQRCRTHFAKKLSSIVSKTQWPTLLAMFQTIFQQPDAIAVWAQAREVADYLEEALDELLAFSAAPKAVWTKV
jgi:putative transposase